MQMAKLLLKWTERKRGPTLLKKSMLREKKSKKTHFCRHHNSNFKYLKNIHGLRVKKKFTNLFKDIQHISFYVQDWSLPTKYQEDT